MFSNSIHSQNLLDLVTSGPQRPRETQEEANRQDQCYGKTIHSFQAVVHKGQNEMKVRVQGRLYSHCAANIQLTLIPVSEERLPLLLKLTAKGASR